jgi:hypothetical protein
MAKRNGRRQLIAGQHSLSAARHLKTILYIPIF